MSKTLAVLIVEDSESDLLLIIRELKKGGYSPVYERVETASAMKKALKEKQWDIILCDYKMPEFNAPSAIALLNETNIDIPLIIVSGTIGEETAVECMRSGAHDYLMKDNLSRLCPAIARELEEAESRRKCKLAEDEKKDAHERFVAVLNGLDAIVYVADMKTYELLFVNKYVNDIFGDIIGQPCWKAIQTGKSGPCAFCTNDKLLDAAGNPTGIYHWEFQNTVNNCWYDIRDRALQWVDGRMVRMEIAVDITERKGMENQLREQLAEINKLKIRLQAENVYLRKEIEMELGLVNIIGESDALRHVLLMAQQGASTDVTVLILGQTGTGKGMVAHAIHAMSPRKEKPMVTINCAAIPENLFESELFGREKGAFTGAHTRQIGRFEVADGGTIFMDEIGDMPLALQTKLLRVLQDGEFERLGSTKTVKVDVRVIAATSRDLKNDVSTGRFREDLFYRLNVFPVSIPPLSMRIEDIPLLVNHFVDKYSRKYSRKIEIVSKSTMQKLQDYHWPGNVRELEHLIERAVIISPGSELIILEGLGHEEADKGEDSLKDLETTEREHILKVLQKTKWKVQGKRGAAAILGLNPSTLRFRIKKLGITHP